MIIFNDAFSNEEKILLDFLLKYDFENKEETINYINSLSSENIVRDYSKYYKIIEFRTSNVKDGYAGMSPIIQVQRKRKDKDSPTIFTLYSKDGLPFEYEIYNADSSPVDMERIFDGEDLCTSSLFQ